MYRNVSYRSELRTHNSLSAACFSCLLDDDWVPGGWTTSLSESSKGRLIDRRHWFLKADRLN
jgi:hypothetical protein